MEKAHAPRRDRHALKLIALFEASKGLAALAAVIGLLDLLHHDLRHLAIELIGHFHLNPEAHYPSVLLHYADQLTGADVHSMVMLAAAYIALRLLEAAGLWFGRAWGEWIGVLSGGLYIPFEIEHLVQRPTLIAVAVLAFNGLLIAYLVTRLWARRRTAASELS